MTTEPTTTCLDPRCHLVEDHEGPCVHDLDARRPLTRQDRERIADARWEVETEVH